MAGQRTKPLSGYKVIELSTFVAAPSCGRLLRDWGADVIKVESGKGDAWRYHGSTHRVTSTEEENPMFDLVNAGKKSVVVDLKSAEGKAVLYDLLSDADIFLTNTRAKSLRKLGLDYESLKERFPKLIYASVTGFGEEGPETDKPGFDLVAYWGNSGFLNDLSIDTGTSYPILAPTGIGDVTCGTALFGGICAALLGRERTGKGDYVTISLFGGAIWIMSFMYLRAQQRYGDPFPKHREETPPLTAPYRCKDGEWLMLSILEYERYFPALCKVLGVPELAEDPRFADKKAADQHRGELIRALEERFIREDFAYWNKALNESDIVNDRLRHFKDIVDSEQAWVNHYLTKVEFPGGGECVMPRPAVQSREMGVPELERGPLLGADTPEVLSERLGYSGEKIKALLKSGAVQQHP